MVTRARAMLVFVVVLVVAAATVFVIRTRDDFHEASAGLAASRNHLADLDTALRDAVVARADAFAALDHAREVLRADTAARDRLRATDRSEYRLLVAALQTLAERRAQLAASTARARRLDECLIGASQALNEAAVGDVVHLAATLPRAQRLCAEVEA